MDHVVNSLKRPFRALSIPRPSPRAWTASKSSRACRTVSGSTQISMARVSPALSSFWSWPWVSQNEWVPGILADVHQRSTMKSQKVQEACQRVMRPNAAFRHRPRATHPRTVLCSVSTRKRRRRRVSPSPICGDVSCRGLWELKADDSLQATRRSSDPTRCSERTQASIRRERQGFRRDREEGVGMPCHAQCS